MENIEKIPMPLNKKRCPNGYKKDGNFCKKTQKNINQKKKSPKIPARRAPEQFSSPQDKIPFPNDKKRCPNGYKKNGSYCIKTKKNYSNKVSPSIKLKNLIKNKADKIIIPKNKISLEEKSLSIAANDLANNKKLISKPFDQSIFQEIRSSLINKKSYSPSLNKLLVDSKKNIEYENFFGCGLEELLLHQLNDKEKVMIKVGNKCVNYKSKPAQNLFLNNLSIRRIDCNKLRAPLQVDSNCWFNTMFVTFFFSDKGRKFFKFFRQLMITGKDTENKPIQPPILAKTFFILNACIESCQNQFENNFDKLALRINTNNIIRSIYHNIPFNKRSKNIVNVSEANNPIDYYLAILTFLKTKSITLTRIERGVFQDILLNNYSPSDFDSIPQVLVVELWEQEGITKPLKFKWGKYEYILDSAIIRDTKKLHFCSVITCNEKEYGFDGASFERIQNFEWKKLLEKNKDWTFSGSNFNNEPNNPIYWNFINSYQLLFYYRNS